jgi:hypothetical protein
MGRMSREEYQAWKQETVSIPIDAVIKQTARALVLKVEGDEVVVGMSVIENLEDLQGQLRRTIENQEKAELVVDVPRWLAHENGWEDDDPPDDW